MFNENSIVVQAWVRRIRDDDGKVTYDDVPALSNLRDVVRDVLDNTREDDANV